jgi:hypothetical protein
MLRTVTVDVDMNVEEMMSELEDDDLIEELLARGYMEPMKRKDYISTKNETEDIVWYFRNGRYQDFFLALERENPELVGITEIFSPVR